MKYVNQKEYPDWLYVTRTDLDEQNREYGRTTTVASSACGLCSAVMVADRLLANNPFDLKDALKLSYETKANHRIGTDYQRFAPAFAEKLGLDWEATNDPQRLVYCLQTGGAAVVHVAGNREDRLGLLSRSGHYIVAVSQERDGRIALLDPAYQPGRYDVPGYEDKVTLKEGVTTVVELQLLTEETVKDAPGFHLFWRK